MMDYTLPVWTSAARSDVRKLQVLQSKWLDIANIARWCTGNMNIHGDLGVHFFIDHIVSLTVSTQS